MKRLILTIALMLGFAAVASAQNYAVVNSEKIFKSIESYNAAISELDKLANDYQTEVDKQFEEVENLYNKYIAYEAYIARLQPDIAFACEHKKGQHYEHSRFQRQPEGR